MLAVARVAHLLLEPSALPELVVAVPQGHPGTETAGMEPRTRVVEVVAGLIQPALHDPAALADPVL